MSSPAAAASGSKYSQKGTKGTWTEEEDATVLRAVQSVEAAIEKSGEESTCWAGIAESLPGRTGRQVRDRWNNYLNPVINHQPFTREDDIKLWNATRTMGNKWVEISKKIFKSTRSENQCKNRWNSAAFKKFAREEFGVEGRLTFETDTEKAIRRQKTYTNVLPVDPSMIPKIKGKKSKIKKGTPRPTEIHDPNHAKMQREMTMLAAARGLINLPKQDMKPVPSGKLWTSEEDAIVLRHCSAEKNFSNWSGLATKHLPDRTGKQIRDRWNNYLNPSINHEAWTDTEDLRLWNAHKEIGKRWTSIGIEKFHTTRSENQLKNRFYSAGFKKFIKEKFGPDAYENAKQEAVYKVAANSPTTGDWSGKKRPSPSATTAPSVSDSAKKIKLASETLIGLGGNKTPNKVPEVAKVTPGNN